MSVRLCDGWIESAYEYARVREREIEIVCVCKSEYVGVSVLIQKGENIFSMNS